MSKKLTAMERIEMLVDAGSFLEIGASVRAASCGEDTLGDGVITGYGTVNGRLVYVYSQDPEKLGGSLDVRHIKKMITLYELARKTGAPVAGFLDSNGFRLAEAEESLCSETCSPCRVHVRVRSPFTLPYSDSAEAPGPYPRPWRTSSSSARKESCS